MTGPQLKLWRHLQNWTQGQAAAWYGVHERTWRRYEDRDGSIPAHLIRCIQLEREAREAAQQVTANHQPELQA